MAEAALERLEPELGDVRIVFPLGHLDDLRAHQSGQINSHQPVSLRLLRVELDDELLLRVHRNGVARGQLQQPSGCVVGVDRQPRDRRTPGRVFLRQLDAELLAVLGRHAHFLARHHPIAGNVDLASVHFDVAVPDQLARAAARRRETHAVDDVVEPGFERHQQVGALDAGQPRRARIGVAELRLGQAVHPLDLLLFAQLLGVLGHLAPATSRLPVLPRRILAALDGALLGQAAGALEEQLGAFAPAEAALWSGVSHGSDPPLLRRTAAVVRDRGDIADRRHLEAHRGERLDGRLAAAARPLHPHVHLAHAEIERLARAVLAGHRGGEGRRLLGALESRLAGGSPRHRVATEVGDGDQHVVERRGDMNDPLGFHQLLRALGARLRSSDGCGHGLLLGHLLLAGDGPTRALLGPGVGMRALTAHRQATAMTNAAIAADVHQALDVHGDFGAQRALGLGGTLDDLAQTPDFNVSQVAHPRVRVDAGLREQLAAGHATDAEDVGESDFDALLARQVDPCDTRHVSPAAACAWWCGCRSRAPHPVA